jgi:AraC-like DNA-binding protein
MTKNRLHTLTHLHGIEVFEANGTRQSYGKHAHAGFAIGVITEGVGGYWCRGACHVLPSRTLTLMNPEEPHTGYSVGAALGYKMLYVPEEAVRVLLDLRRLRGFAEINAVDQGDQIAHGMLELSRLINTKIRVPAAELRIEELLSNLLVRIFQFHGRQEFRPPGREPQAVSRIAERIDAHVLLRAGEELTIADLAADVGLSPKYMIQSFTATRGISPHAYLIYRKICRAKQMITGGMSPLDTALELGFYDQSHFIRTFRKVLGITPGALIIH